MGLMRNYGLSWERYEDEASGQLLVRAVNDVGDALNIDDDPEMEKAGHCRNAWMVSTITSP